jgi:sulfatase modifying factor 1
MGTLMIGVFKKFLVNPFIRGSKVDFSLFFFFFCLFLFSSCNQKGKTDSAESKSDSKGAVYMTLDQITFNGDTSKAGMVSIPGGEFMMGADNEQADKDEYPKHKVILDPFWIDQHEVTNDQFAKFIESTGYVTTAERKPDWRN